jgi:hypothetical protein
MRRANSNPNLPPPKRKTPPSAPDPRQQRLFEEPPDDGVPKTGVASLKKSRAQIGTQTDGVLKTVADAGRAGATRAEIVAKTGINSHAADKCIQVLIDAGKIRYHSKRTRIHAATGRAHTALVAVPQWTRTDPAFRDMWKRFDGYLKEAERLREEKERNHRRMLNVLAKIDKQASRR